MNRYFTFKKTSFHKEPNIWIKLSWKIKVQNASEISIPFPIINSWPSQEPNCSQINESSHISSAPATVSEKVYLCSRQPPTSLSHYHFPKPGISLFVSDNSGSGLFHLGWGNTVVIQKMKTEKQIPDLTHCCCGKTLPPNHWNYH